jgi:hypothetical protein
MRKTVIACLAVALVVAGGLVALLRPQPGRINPAAARRIKEGMTQSEVHALMGGPPEDRTRPGAPLVFVSHFSSGPFRLVEQWDGDYGAVRVDYYPYISGNSDKVMSARYEEAVPFGLAGVGLARWRLGKWWEEVIP